MRKTPRQVRIWTTPAHAHFLPFPFLRFLSHPFLSFSHFFPSVHPSEARPCPPSSPFLSCFPFLHFFSVFHHYDLILIVHAAVERLCRSVSLCLCLSVSCTHTNKLIIKNSSESQACYDVTLPALRPGLLHAGRRVPSRGSLVAGATTRGGCALCHTATGREDTCTHCIP